MALAPAQVGGNVHRSLGSAVNAAYAAGGEDLDAGHRGYDHGGGYRGGAVLSPGDEHRQVAAGGLGDRLPLLAEVLYLILAEACLEAAADDGDGRGHCAVVAYGLLHAQGRLHVLRIGHAVGDYGGLEGHYGAPGRKGFGNLR